MHQQGLAHHDIKAVIGKIKLVTITFLKLEFNSQIQFEVCDDSFE